MIKSHVVNPDYLYANDFYGFFNDRKEQIIQRIEKAMGKTIVRDMSLTEEGSFVDDTEQVE